MARLHFPIKNIFVKNRVFKNISVHYQQFYQMQSLPNISFTLKSEFTNYTTEIKTGPSGVNSGSLKNIPLSIKKKKDRGHKISHKTLNNFLLGLVRSLLGTSSFLDI